MPNFSFAPILKGYSPLVMLLGWVAGTALQLQQVALVPWWAYVLGGLASGAVAGAVVALGHPSVSAGSPGPWRWMQARGARIVLTGLVAATLGASLTGLRSVAFMASALDPGLEGRDVWVTGVVTDPPQGNEAGLRFRLAVEHATLGGQAVTLPPLVNVGWYGGAFPSATGILDLQRKAPALRAGERWSLTLRLKAPHGSRNPHGFDYELWMWEQGVQASAYVRNGPRDAPPQRLGATGHYPVALARQLVRERIFASVESPSIAGVLSALVMGDQAAIERSDWDVFRATGVAHLMSISGLHITMLAWGATWCMAWLWRRSERLCLILPAADAALVAGAVVALAYSLFAGWGVPAQRTCIMLSAVLVLRASGLVWPWPSVWALALALVCAFDPWALLQAGFWLSFVAVGVLFASGTSPSAGTQGGRIRRVMQALRASLREQWVITVALAPLTLLLFGQIAVLGLLANAVAIPVVTLLITPLAMLGVLLPGPWALAGTLLEWLMGGLQGLSALDAAVWSSARPPLFLAGCAVLGGVLVVTRLPWFARALGLPLLLPALLWQSPVPAEGTFMVLAADVGQGNAILVRTRQHALLFDAGPRYSTDNDAGHRVLVPLLQALNVKLDTLVLSHRDIDHTGGAPAMLKMFPGVPVRSSLQADHPLLALRIAQACLAGQHWRWDGVDFEVLHPQADAYASAVKSNALSCVLRISAGGRAALLTGDIEEAQERAIVQASARGDFEVGSDLLLVPHHGSKTSSNAEWIDAVRPRFAWVQSGYRNRFGHPAAEVIERYRVRGITVHDSPHCGAMTWHSAQPEQVDCTRIQEQRYWFHAVP